jgi:hypothetical protein
LVESLRKAEESHAAEVEAIRVEHAQALRLKEVEVDDLINRLKAEHEETLLERLAIAAADLEKAHQDHAEAFGKLEAEHEMELRRRSEEIEELLAKEKQTHEESLTAALASHTSAISLKESQYATAQKRLEEAEEALRTAKLEHAAALEKVATDHAASLKVKDVELSETIAKTEEEYYNALTKLRQDHSRPSRGRSGSPPSPWNGSRKNTPASYGSLKSPRKAHSQNPRPLRRRLSEICGKLTLRPFLRRKPTLPTTWKVSRPNTRRFCLQLQNPTLLSSRRLDRIMPWPCRSCKRNLRRNPCDWENW